MFGEFLESPLLHENPRVLRRQVLQGRALLGWVLLRSILPKLRGWVLLLRLSFLGLSDRFLDKSSTNPRFCPAKRGHRRNRR